MAKPVPSDAMGEQPVQDSHDQLKAQEMQEDEQAQDLAAQASSEASNPQPLEPQTNGNSLDTQTVQARIQEALSPSMYGLLCMLACTSKEQTKILSAHIDSDAKAIVQAKRMVQDLHVRLVTLMCFAHSDNACVNDRQLAE